MVSVCDCLNFARIEVAIAREDVESLVLQRFIFYTAICRCVNGRVIREVEHVFAKNGWLRSKVEQELAEYFRMLISSFRHACSFNKYQQRLREMGMTVPPYIEELIWQYLQRTEKRGAGPGKRRQAVVVFAANGSLSTMKLFVDGFYERRKFQN